MEKKFGNGDDRLFGYCVDVFKPTSDIHTQVISHCKANSLPPIWVNEMDGKHLEVLAAMATTNKNHPTKIVEIGTLGGYSAICMGLVIPESGKIFTLEITAKSAKVARENIEIAGLTQKIEVMLGDAIIGLESLVSQGPFDLIFIDADKSNYLHYGRWAVQNLRVGGLLVADNTFAWGLVLQANIDNPDTAASVRGIRDFNSFVASDPRFISTLFPTGEGLTVAVKINDQVPP